ncbi:MAG: hypothetical protein ACHQ6U_12760, partial [Thermodesulfobacteriota bacterium]
MLGGTTSGSRRTGKSSGLIGNDSELTCVVLHGARRDTGNIRELLEPLRKYLHEKGIQLNLLSDYSHLNGHYADRFEEFARGCLLGVLILDGMGPDELYQLGFLRGGGKIILTIGARGMSPLDKDTDGVREEGSSVSAADLEPGRGSDSSRFCCERILNGHLKESIELDSSPDIEEQGIYSENAIREKLQEALPGIMESYMYDCLRTVENQGAEETESLRIIVLRLCECCTSRNGYDFANLDEMCIALDAWESNAGVLVPSRILSCLASLYSGLLETEDDETLIREYSRKCSGIYERILERKESGLFAGLTGKKLADSLVRYAFFVGEKEKIEEATGIYRKVLGLFTADKYPHEFTAVRNNLGVALDTLSRLTGECEHGEAAVSSLIEALSSGRSVISPPECALVAYNLGTAYSNLARHDDRRETLLNALEAFREALLFYTPENFPEEHARLMTKTGDIYQGLALSENDVLAARESINA